MYAYTGWNASTYIVSEIRDPQRNVPRSVLIATLSVVGLYLGANAVFLHTTPMTEMAQAAAANKPNVASLAAAHIFGRDGGLVMDAFICLSLISTVSSMIWIGPRVTVAIGEDLPALRLLAKKTRSGIPRVALALQLAIVNVIIFTATFDSIMVAIGLVLTLCSFMTVLGVIVLRRRRPDLPRPYKTWGYPVTPVIFLVVSFWMMIHILRSNPTESMVGLGVSALGLVVYYGFHRETPKTAAA
jgi:APA family basic amino acid/polyamine antiporter